jgi:hypothetical protein
MTANEIIVWGNRVAFIPESTDEARIQPSSELVKRPGIAWRKGKYNRIVSLSSTSHRNRNTNPVKQSPMRPEGFWIYQCSR